MEEDDYLVEVAGWARYYEKANEHIQQIRAVRLADRPPQEVIDDPRQFEEWLEQCEQAYLMRQNLSGS